jgi:hypothetical protein
MAANEEEIKNKPKTVNRIIKKEVFLIFVSYLFFWG